MGLVSSRSRQGRATRRPSLPRGDGAHGWVGNKETMCVPPPPPRSIGSGGIEAESSVLHYTLCGDVTVTVSRAPSGWPPSMTGRTQPREINWHFSENLPAAEGRSSGQVGLSWHGTRWTDIWLLACGL